jgi:hypothetical protein
MTITVPETIDLRAKVLNVKVMRGDSWAIKVTITGYNLTGYTIEGHVRETHESPVKQDMTINVSNAAGGEFYVGQDAALTDGYYDVQLTPPSGLPRTWVKGRVSLDADVTHD